MTDKITMDGRYTTRAGREWVTLCVDAPGPRPVVGYWIDNNGVAKVGARSANGKVYPYAKIDDDLVPAPASGTDWIVRWEHNGDRRADIYLTEASAYARARELQRVGRSIHVAGPYRVDWTEES